MAQTTIETPSGQGNLYNGPTLIADVRYRLHIGKYFRTLKPHVGSGGSGKLRAKGWRLPGPLIITGEIEVIRGEGDLCGAFTLHLADQRQWACVITAGDAVAGKYQAISDVGGLTAKM
jgi:hypothetical protein